MIRRRVPSGLPVLCGVVGPVDPCLRERLRGCDRVSSDVVFGAVFWGMFRDVVEASAGALATCVMGRGA